MQYQSNTDACDRLPDWLVSRNAGECSLIFIKEVLPDWPLKHCSSYQLILTSLFLPSFSLFHAPRILRCRMPT